MSSTATAIDGHKATLQRVHQDVLGRNADSKTLNYWANCLANNFKTAEDFERTLLNSTEYKHHLSKLFKEAYFDHVGADVPADDVAQFVEAQVGQRVSAEAAFAHISRLPQFEDKYAKLIGTLYSLHKSQPTCSLDITQHYIRRLRADPGYDVEQLTAAIIADDHLQEAAGGVQQEGGAGVSAAGGLAAGVDGAAAASQRGNSYVQAFVQANGREPTDADFVQQQRLAEEHQQAPQLDAELVDDLEAVFGRPMYVHEYQKYVLEAGERAQAYTDSDLEELLVMHTTNYNRLRDIYKSYTGCDLAEYDYVKRFLYKVDDPTFFDTIVDGVVQSKDYEVSMKRLLAAKHTSMHDEQLEEHDANYLFGVVRQRKLGMDSDMLERLLQAFKLETDEITQHIFQQYLVVLERQPDMYEVERTVAFYRERLPAPLCTDGIGAIDEWLEDRLMRSLEFHDVCKARIKTLTRARRDKDVLPSVLFEQLQRVLAEIGSIRAADLDATIVRIASL